MMIGGYSIAGRLVAMVVGGLFLLAVISFGVTQCQKRRSQAAQGRVNAEMGSAYQNSVTDAVAAAGEANKRETESEALTRSNERTIRDAQGANDAVNPGVRDAGFASLCRRPSYRNSPDGRVRCAPAPGVAQRR